MNILLLTYSDTGNNGKFAARVAEKLGAKGITIAPKKHRPTCGLVMDLILSREPKVTPAPEIMREYDLIVFCSPVWMGQVASPLRAYLGALRTNPKPYVLLCVSGGSGGGNPKLAEELERRTGKKPALVFEQTIADLLPADADKSIKATSAYRISDAEAERLATVAARTLETIL
ncbi:MAG TPA: NAD(P)H-dependent oxidoreductase [Clostridia bacterium]|nr:NAD(P)H-dependent oxidoreductase [Clostridia bacterium]